MMGLNASKEDRVFLARLYWFTIEFGLLDTPKGLRVYGGGILSSPSETQYALHDKNVERKPLDVLRCITNTIPHRYYAADIFYVNES